MTTDAERITQLEAAQAALEARDARRESEHRNLLKTYEEATASREALRLELETDYELLGKAIDNRIDGIVKCISRGGVDNETLAAVLREIAMETGAVMAETLAAQETRIMQRVSALFAKMATAEGNIRATVDRLLNAHGNAA